MLPTAATTKLPTAPLAFNDMIAFGVLLGAAHARRPVPEAVSLIGYDDTKLAGLSSVGLTRVGQDAARLAGITTRLPPPERKAAHSRTRERRCCRRS
jgi:DNA-binding LacI/PurR family transcriptional regulator